MMKPPKIIFFDIDNTLYLPHENRIPSSALRALTALREREIITAIATGRTISTMPAPAKSLIQKGEIDLVVAINGQYIQYQGKELTTFPMDKTLAKHISARLHQQSIAHAFVSHDRISVSQTSPQLENLCASMGIEVEHCAHPDSSPIYQIIAFFPASRDHEIQATLPEDIKIVRWHEHGVDILSKNGSKARGIQAALQHLGLNFADSMAFGDGMNDMEMILAVNFGIAMGNAEPALKAIADHICPAAVDDGIWRALVDLDILSPD